ncbi:hypothetical protein FMM80_26780 [Schaedlerella arabinosiphila]|uniref:Uncharacterized protein n=1 Tax=Schaedlerella arabinosiphila TaxID=2044587 RepID=A0A9X5CF81_9FIRM|nr:hypothetical protein [Schaedlerella arabinosiphila]NDO72057.1 hypothetical protein [Schaedlerella arabinosiphila]
MEEEIKKKNRKRAEIWALKSFRDRSTYDMEAGTLTIDKDLASAALRDIRQNAYEVGLYDLPTVAYINVNAMTISGEDILRFNSIPKETDDLITSVNAWLLDLTNFDWTAEELKIVPEATDYTYMKGDQGGATIKCTGALEDFVSVEVDGALVDHNNVSASKDGV